MARGWVSAVSAGTVSWGTVSWPGNNKSHPPWSPALLACQRRREAACARPLRLLERHQDKVDSRVTGVAHIMRLTRIDGVYPAHLPVRAENIRLF